MADKKEDLLVAPDDLHICIRTTPLAAGSIRIHRAGIVNLPAGMMQSNSSMTRDKRKGNYTRTSFFSPASDGQIDRHLGTRETDSSSIALDVLQSGRGHCR